MLICRDHIRLENMVLTGAIQFTNWTDADFVHAWNNVPYRIPKGATMMLETGIAHTFVKHLVDRELHKLKKDLTDSSREDLERRCLAGNAGIAETDPDKLKHDIANANGGQKPKEEKPEPKKEDDDDEDTQPIKDEDEAKEFPELKK